MRYDEHLNDEERAFLKIFSAFRIPVDKTAFEYVFGRNSRKNGTNLLSAWMMPSLTRWLSDWLTIAYCVTYLRTDMYNTHPLIRSHYYDLLLAGEKSQAIDTHRLLKEYYLAKSEDMPDKPTLDDMKPLIEAMYNACRSGVYDEASNILWDRIYQHNKFYLSQTLCANETELTIFQEFFPEGDTSQDPLVSHPTTKGWILNDIGFCLMYLGQLDLSRQFFERASLIASNTTKDWLNASRIYQNLSDLYVSLGALDRSAEAAQQALELTIRAKNKQDECNTIARIAFTEHLQGKLLVASMDFEKAKMLQKKTRPIVQNLFSFTGIRHADHLIRIGNTAYAREVIETNLEICKWSHWPYLISRCHRVFGDLDTNSGDRSSARIHYNEALKIAHKITDRHSLIEALLARGRWSAKHMKSASEAFRDLEEALNYATTSGFRIYETISEWHLPGHTLPQAPKKGLKLKPFMPSK